MSCQIRLIGNIIDTEEIRKGLFPYDNKLGCDNWLQNCYVSVCPTGDIIAFAKDRRLIIVSSKWDSVSLTSQFQIVFSGMVHETDNIRGVLCLPLVGRTKSSHVTPDWTCILLAFESGYIRIFMETCELLYEEQFHNESIISVKCQSQHNPRPDISLDLHSEELYIQYQSNICVISGNQLFPILRSNRAQLARVQANSELLTLGQQSVNVRKWGFQDQSIINDIAVVGLPVSNVFDHLLNASTCGGFDTKFRSVPPISTLVLGAGSKPFLGFHYAIEGVNLPVLTDVAKAVANKLKSALPNWLTGNTSQTEKRPSAAMQPADQMGCRFGLCDLNRTANTIILSPNHKLAAISDSLGRVILIDTEKGITLRILKGYRDAQCSFMQVPDERKTKYKVGDKVSLFLIIYSSKRGTLEMFTTQNCTKISTFSASKNSRLIYVNYGLMGFLQPTKSKYICPFTTLFMDGDGQIKEILIPFHFSLDEKDNKRARDIHIFKKLKEFIKFETYDEDTLLTEVLNTSKELHTIELKVQLIESLLDTKTLPVDVLLKCAQYFGSSLIDNDDMTNNLRLKVLNMVALLNFYLFMSDSNTGNNKNDHPPEISPPILLKLESKEMSSLQKLHDLSKKIAGDNSCELKVTFSEKEIFSPSDYLSAFDLTKEIICLSSNRKEDIVYKVSEYLFHDYIIKGKNYEYFQEEVVKSRISVRDIFFMLISYWVNRPLNASLNLEIEMNTLTYVLYLLIKSSNDLCIEDSDMVGDFWSEIRVILANSNNPLLASTAAMLCKYVAYTIERERDLEQSNVSLDIDDIEIWSQDNIEWTLLIGKLEDVTLLNILLMYKPKVNKNSSLPKLERDNFDFSLKYVLERKGSVSELVARWLSQCGIEPEYIVIDDRIHRVISEEEKSKKTDDEDDREDFEPEPEPIIPADKIDFVQNEILFEYLNMMRVQWPYSLEAEMILANMSWEYALEWKKDIQNLSYIEASIACLKEIPNFHLRLGLFNLVWKTHLKILFENVTKLLNRVGKVPKEKVCRLDTGLTDLQIPIFISICTDFLDTMSRIVQDIYNAPKANLNFEPIWENGGQPLAELAIQQTNINYDLVSVHYQLGLIFQMLCTFSMRAVKPIDNLFDSEVITVLFFDFQEKPEIDYSRTGSKLTSIREQFLTKVITSSIEVITEKENEIYTNDHVYWMSKCRLLGMIWNLDIDVLNLHQVVQLFTHGYNTFAHDISSAVKNRKKLGVELLAIAGKRMSKYIAASINLGAHLSALTPTVTRYMKSLNGDWCAESTLKDIIDLTTLSVSCLEDDTNRYEWKVGMLLLEGCLNLRNHNVK